MRKTGYQSYTKMYQKLLFAQPVDLQLQAFFNTPLGELYQAIPFKELADKFRAPKRAIRGKGARVVSPSLI